MGKYSGFLENAILEIIEKHDSLDAAKVIYDWFTDDTEISEAERLDIRSSNERLTKLNRRLGGLVTGLMKETSTLLEYVQNHIRFEKNVENRVKVKSIGFEEMKWQVTYELDGNERTVEFDFEFCDESDLCGKSAKHIEIDANADEFMRKLLESVSQPGCACYCI